MQVTDKRQQRAFYKELRKRIEPDKKQELDFKILKRLLNFTQGSDYKGKLILPYVSNGFEIDTVKFIEALISDGCKTAVPRCKNNSNIMDFYYINSLSDLEAGAFGISEPKSFCEKVTDYENSLCIVPAICFDRNGYRIGYGKGFYDRFFSKNKCILKIGLCYEDFLIDRIFTDENDISVDFIITENDIYEFTKGDNYERKG